MGTSPVGLRRIQQLVRMAGGWKREINRELAGEEVEPIALLESGLAKTRESLGGD